MAGETFEAEEQGCGSAVVAKRPLYTNRTLAALVIPIVFEQLTVVALGMADTFLVAGVSEAAVSGVTLVDMITTIMSCLLSALGVGAGIFISQYLGKGDKGRAAHAANQIFLLEIVAASLLCVVCVVFNGPILALLFGSIEADVMAAAGEYFFITAFSYVVMGVYFSGSALFRAMGKSRTVMVVSVSANAVNIVGDILGVAVFHAGVAGVAVPTLASWVAAAVAMVVLAGSPSCELRVSARKVFLPDLAMQRRLLTLALPNAAESGLFQLGRLIVGMIVATFGTSQIAANGVAQIFGMIAVAVGNGISIASITVVGMCVGAGAYDQVKTNVRKLLAASYVGFALVGALVVLLLVPVLPLFNIEEETARLVWVLVVIHNVGALALHPTAWMLSNVIRAAGDVRFTLIVGVASMMLLRLAAAWFLGVACGLGIVGVWIAMLLDWALRSVCFVWRYRSGGWKRHRVV